MRYLNKYLRSRPAKEDLRRKGIIEGARLPRDPFYLNIAMPIHA